MTIIADILPIIQVIISIVLVIIILLQQSEGGGLGSSFGGGSGGGSYQSRRGLERILFITTIVLGVLFVLSTLLALILK